MSMQQEIRHNEFKKVVHRAIEKDLRYVPSLKVRVRDMFLKLLVEITVISHKLTKK